MSREVEYGFLTEHGVVEIAAVTEDFVIFCFGLRDDLTVRVGDQRAGHQWMTIFYPSLSDTHYPSAVLVGTRLDAQCAMKKPLLFTLCAFL